MANAQSYQADSTEEKTDAFLLSPHGGFVLVEGAFDNPLSSVHRTDKAEQFGNAFFQRLSTPSSASQNLIFDCNSTTSHHFLPDLFAAYTYLPQNVLYFQTSKPHSNLKYSSSINSSQYFSVFHTQNLTRNWNIGLRYDVNYLDGTFAKSAVMNQFFNLTTNYISKNGRYRLAGAFIRNRAYVLENGGLLSDSLFQNQLFSKPETYPTNLSEGYSKYKTADFSLYQSFDFNRNKETASKIFNPGRLCLQTNFMRSARIYKDEYLTEADSLATRSLQNNLFWTNESETNKRLIVSIGAKHELLMFSDKSNSPVFNILSPTAKVVFNLKMFSFSAEGTRSLSSESYNGDYDLRASASMSVKNSHISIVAGSGKQTNQYIYSHYEGENLSYKLPQEKTDYSFLKASYWFADIFACNLNYFQTNNRPVVRSSDMTIVYSDIINIIQARLLAKKEWQHFGLQIDCVLQHIDDETYLHLPLFMAKQSIYFKFNLFGGKLETNTGIDFRYNTSYYADKYLPEVGLFAFQSENKYGNYPYCDLFVNARIDKCNVFLALSHPYAGLFGYNYISTPLYPEEGLSLRWGLSWNFVN
ncbi:MAG: putative porin [Candidatus Onthomorpha sp.]